jgi:hypothetical protein
MGPTAATPETRSRNLVFTSAGNRANVHAWLEGQRDFDLWVVYYGDEPGKFQGLANFHLDRKGSKFQNLHYCYEQWPQALARYDAVMVMDDDIMIDATGVTRLFEVRRERDLWALQPAFRWCGKVSWDITAVHSTAKLRYTNFIEMACPLIRQDKLAVFMAAYDPQLVGYGVDWWFLQTLGAELQNHVAVVDEVTCINPYDREKGGVREIDTLQSHEKRKEVWERMKALHGLNEQGRQQVEFGRVRQSPAGAAVSLVRYFPDWAYFNAKRVARQWVSRGSRAGR